MLRPFWRYFGGKWRAAPRYPSPRHATIVEPFAGAAGYSMRYPQRRVILVEKDPVIAEIWRYLIGASEAEVRAIPLVEDLADLPSWVPQGARNLIGFSFASAVQRMRNRLSAGMRRRQEEGGAVYGWTELTRHRVASQLRAIRHWQIIEGDYSEAPNIEATWFIDPPYEIMGYAYTYSSKLIDFPALGAWCRSRRGQVIACEADGATWLPFAPFGGGRRSAINDSASREAIWTNYPRDEQPSLPWEAAS